MGGFSQEVGAVEKEEERRGEKIVNYDGLIPRGSHIYFASNLFGLTFYFAVDTCYHGTEGALCMCKGDVKWKHKIEVAKLRLVESTWVVPGPWHVIHCSHVLNLIREDSLKKPKSIVDVGCGIGGSSRYLSRKYGAKCQGITLSPIQVQRAQALADAQAMYGSQVSFQVADALQQPFPDGQFDLVWSMESGEHMPDKIKFVNELIRVASPGATIIIVTWCHRDLSPSEDSLQPQEKELLKKICDAYFLPAWCSTADYAKLLQSLNMEDIKSEDWSEYVAPFWPAVIRTALTWKGLTSLLRSGWKTIKGALAMPLMIEGYNKDLIKFAIITCRKPE
ncbi:hypothetical protein IFM89_003711 [Coptis chinensis]|uniref:Methyltransferase type 11 domain-containing protein n=1 Tax=Coptis chinensis TaxID=261450 RepID=A0A835ME27_9MAGN|nr:hypothetical protein IFM89_003711 [Coptis chinensis]